jgi:hypothetical protein
LKAGLFASKDADENDTWVLFSEQYLDVVHAGKPVGSNEYKLSSMLENATSSGVTVAPLVRGDLQSALIGKMDSADQIFLFPAVRDSLGADSQGSIII